MTTLLELQCDAILRAAVESPSDLGIIVRVVEPGKNAINMKQALYRFRQHFPDAAYKQLQIRISPHNPDTEVWILKRNAATSATNSTNEDASESEENYDTAPSLPEITF